MPVAWFLAVILAATLLAGQSALAADRPDGVPSPQRHRPRIGLVLGGGGARGVAEIGVLQVLEQLRVPVDVVVGTSMGAIVGGAYAMGVAPDDMERRLQRVAWDEVVTDNVPRAQRSVLSKEQERDNIRGIELGFRDGRIRLPRGAVAGHEFELFLTSLLGKAPLLASFDQLPIAYRAVATDIETGDMQVLGQGDLISAIRASMAVPGVFAPVEIDGHLLVDGGLTRNLPVDVARALGAERLIVVDVGSSLLKREEIGSAIGISQQVLTILTHQNVAVSLGQVTADDVLIHIPLGRFSVADFEHAVSTLPQGRAAADAVAASLLTLALDDAAWRAYLTQRQQRRDTQGALTADERLHIDTGGLAHVSPHAVQALMDSHEGEPVQAEVLQRDLARLYATDDFQQIRTRLVSQGSGDSTLVVQPVEKEWGPNYINLDVDLSTDFSGNSRFNARAATRNTWLDAGGLEWRNTFSLGSVNEWGSELYQPLDYSRDVFVAPRLDFRQERNDFYQNDVAVTTYQLTRRVYGLDLGARFGTSAVLRVGVEQGGSTATAAIAQASFPNLTQRLGNYHMRLDADTLDRWAFPSEGALLHLDLQSSRTGLGADSSYDRGDMEIEQAFHVGEQDVRLGLLGGSGFGTRLPVQDLFPLGGFLQLSGYQSRQFLGQRYALGRLITYRSLGDPGAFTRRLFVGMSLEAGNVFDRLNGSNVAGLRHSGSVFLGADTGIGPLYFGLGVAGNSRSAYLFLGRP